MGRHWEMQNGPVSSEHLTKKALRIVRGHIRHTKEDTGKKKYPESVKEKGVSSSPCPGMVLS